MIALSKNLIGGQRQQAIFQLHFENHCRRVDKLLGNLLLAQWLFCILVAAIVSPFAWQGKEYSIHIHLYSAVLLGAVIVSLPFYLAKRFPGKLITRLVISSAQVMFSFLIIHLMGGRNEAHFHVFVSVALLAAYRDRTVFIPAVIMITLDHLIRGYVWPQSVFGTDAINSWRPVEHAAWIMLEVIFVSFTIKQSHRQAIDVARLNCALSEERDTLDQRVNERTYSLMEQSTQLEENRRFQNNVLDSLDAQICILDRHGRVVLRNEKRIRYDRVNGLTENDFGFCKQYLLHGSRDHEDSEFYAEELLKHLREITYSDRDSVVGEFDCVTSGDVRWCQIRATAVPLNNGKGVAVAIIDITETKKATQRAAALAQIVFDSPNEVFVLVIEDMKLIDINQTACQNLGYERQELLNAEPCTIFQDFDQFIQSPEVQSVTTGRGSLINREAVHIRKDGTSYPCRVTLFASQLDDKDVLIVFASDLTEHRKLEMELRHSQKLDAVGQLAAGIAHEINTPMQSIFGNIEFLQSSCSRMMQVHDQVLAILATMNFGYETDQKQIDQLLCTHRYDYLRNQTDLALEESITASKRVISIVRAMNQFSHPGNAMPISTDIHLLIDQAATITRSRWKYIACMEFAFDPELTPIDAFSSELGQVFANLLVNASDAIEEKIGSEPAVLGTIRIETKRLANTVRIAVIDSGAGMSAAVKEKIFEPFFTTKGVGKGSGQGLAIAYAVIVEKHHGTIEVSSVPGVGTTFIIEIPLSQAANAPVLNLGIEAGLGSEGLLLA